MPLESAIKPGVETPGDMIHLAPVVNKNTNFKGSLTSNSAKKNKRKFFVLIFIIKNRFRRNKRIEPENK